MKILAVKKSQSKLFAIFTATLIITSLTSSVFAAPTKKPTQQEIDAAKKIEADKKAAADAAASISCCVGFLVGTAITEGVSEVISNVAVKMANNLLWLFLTASIFTLKLRS